MLIWLEFLRKSLGEYPWAYSILVILLLVLAAVISGWLTRLILLRTMRRFLAGKCASKEEEKIQFGLIPMLAYIVPALVIMGGIAVIPDIELALIELIRKICSSIIIVIVAVGVSKLIDLVDIRYRKRRDAVDKPIKGYLQLFKILAYTIALLLVIANMMDRNPALLLSGLGAMAAVIMLIFQDTILSVVASVQLGTNDMVRIGDWIEMPSQHADGFVIEIALHTVKVQNWDKTITTVPVRKLITDSFINWRGMFDSGGRRIKRSLFIDQRSVRFLDDEEIGRLDDFVLLNDYLNRKRRELADWNAGLEKQGAKPINERRVTNLGTFRAYVEHYLRNHPLIHKDMILLVRQLQPGVSGLPLEIYCFTTDTRWIAHENIQSDIFDHLLAILPVFDLRVFQQCSDVSGMIVPMPALDPSRRVGGENPILQKNDQDQLS